MGRTLKVLAGQLAAVSLTAACSTGTSAPVAWGGPAASSGTRSVSAAYDDVTSTVVLQASVRTGVRFDLPAPFAGSFTLVDGGITYRKPGGESGRLTLPAGLVLTGPPAAGGAAGEVPVNYPIAGVVVTRFALVANLDQTTFYRMYHLPAQGRGQIDQGPGPFDCPLAASVPLPVAQPPADKNGDGTAVVCIVPDTVPVFTGMTGVVAVTTASAAHVLTLPVEAVAGGAEGGEVWYLGSRGERQRRKVTLGITDGVMIAVTSGLGAGDRVAVPAPNLAGRASDGQP